ncbi:hypothetical protein ACFFGH_24265 [Lysobacter korlensis]|uniref:Large exoprotein n=1 Tax=Lysobacter korlensis TaxID=553636 RepID=A0ABV6RVE5_9GAMM
MEFTGGGAGVMLALAAVLWLTYLVPSWFRRREYLATERNAVRLQQSLRILAETAEVPAVVRAESNARSAAAQERALRELEKRRKLEEKRLAAEARSRTAAASRASRGSAIPEPVVVRPAAPGVRPTRAAATPARPPRSPESVRAGRLRRTRRLGSLMLLVGIGLLLTFGWMLATAGASFMVSLGITAGGTLFVLAIALLNRLAAVSRSLARPTAGFRRVRAEVADFEFESEVREWTPVPLPKPLYMSKPVVAPPVMADPREDERKAAAVEAGEVTQLAPASKFAAMGHVDLAAGHAPDLEAAIRRRLNRAV